MRMEGEKIMSECFLCGSEAQQGPHIYNIRNASHWNVLACDTCVKSNWDGIIPGRFPHLEEHLKASKIPVATNENGWIAWPEGFLRPGDIPWRSLKK